MADESNLLQCYNRGCGQKYDPNNFNDTCRHHPGLPFFHDAYKGWSCCNKKCTDFTEFLNIKGCTLSEHSNIKPPEPPKPVANEDIEREIVEIKPMERPIIQRPAIDTPLKTMKPNIAVGLKQQLQAANIASAEQVLNCSESGDILVGTPCQNNGCTVSYQGPETNGASCIYHPGSPIFHEGMKYWSCCLRKTTDFDVFLNQAGCQSGKHLWKKDDDANDKVVDCRWDWHQTGSHVVVSIYAKTYCVDTSIVQLNPIRLFANLVFPQQAHATFTLDIELQGVIDIRASQVSMFSTKVEIKLKKAEPRNWTKIDLPRSHIPTSPVKAIHSSVVEDITPQIESVDLSDL